MRNEPNGTEDDATFYDTTCLYENLLKHGYFL